MSKIALIQYDVVYGNPQANYEKVEGLIKSAMKQNPDVLVLPELWTTGYDLTRLDEIADKDAQASITFLSKLAAQYQVNIVGGSVAKQTGDKVTNTMLTFNRQGSFIMDYQKVHLFRLMEEEKYLVEGDKKGHFELDGVPSAGVICYDIRFPEWLRLHVTEGAQVLYVVAEWPKPRIDHWINLLKSRAIENQAFVIACNRVGSDPKNEFGGHSIIVGPWGEVIAEADDSEQILYGEIDLSEVERVRKTIPVFEDRRPSLYESR